ncbi:MAG: TonB-dependent receptor [Pseudomonadota bacterium]
MIRATLFTLTATTALGSATMCAYAQDDVVELDPIILSGGLTPIPQTAFGRSSTVIDSEALEQQNERYVADVLRTVPGVSVSRSGSFGGLTQVRIRGHEGNHTLVLIDGVEVNSVDQGEFDFGGLVTADIDRIEVLRGPQSSIYGSNAIGGVISITTKRATTPGFSTTVEADVGSDETFGGLIAVRRGFEQGGLSFSASHRDTGGFDVSGSGGEDDGDQNTTLNFTGDYEFMPGFRVGGTLRSVNRRSDFDDFNFGAPTTDGLVTDSDNHTDVDDLFGSAFAEVDAFGGRLANRVGLTYAKTDRESKNDGTPTADNSGERVTLSYLGTVALDTPTVASARQTMSFAVQYEEENYKENNPDIVFDPGQLSRRERSQAGYVLEYRGSFDVGLDLQASVRYDDNDEFKDFTTYAVGLSQMLPNATTRLHASAGTGVQNPTLIEQFGFFDDFQGNPDLEPEQSTGFDIGFEQIFAGGAGLIDVTYFQEDLTDTIGREFVPETERFQPVNLDGTSHRRGVEVTGAYIISDAFDVSLAYTYLDATEEVPTEDGGTRDVVEVRRPEHELYLQGTYRFPNDQTSVNVGIQYVSGLYDLDFKTASFISGEFDDDFDRVKLDDYTLVDVSFRHDFNELVTLTGAINNLFDQDYQELEGYATQGLVAYLGLTATF